MLWKVYPPHWDFSQWFLKLNGSYVTNAGRGYITCALHVWVGNHQGGCRLDPSWALLFESNHVFFPIMYTPSSVATWYVLHQQHYAMHIEYCHGHFPPKFAKWIEQYESKSMVSNPLDENWLLDGQTMNMHTWCSRCRNKNLCWECVLQEWHLEFFSLTLLAILIN